MFNITIKLHSNLKIYLKGKKDKKEYNIVTVDSPISINEIIDMFKIDRGQIGVITLDGQLVTQEEIVKKDSKIDIYPIFPGG